jgi:hypothetical protein
MQTPETGTLLGKLEASVGVLDDSFPTVEEQPSQICKRLQMAKQDKVLQIVCSCGALSLGFDQCGWGRDYRCRWEARGIQ